MEASGKWGYIDASGRYVIEPKFESARGFSGGLAAAKSKGSWGYIDRTGMWVIPPSYKTADDFSDGPALTSDGYIDRAGVKLATAHRGSAFVQGLAHVTLPDQHFGYIDHSGRVVFRYSAAAVQPSKLPYSGR